MPITHWSLLTSRIESTVEHKYILGIRPQKATLKALKRAYVLGWQMLCDLVTWHGPSQVAA